MRNSSLTQLPHFLTFNGRTSALEHNDRALTTIQALDTHENISSHLCTIKKSSRRRDMSVARLSSETEQKLNSKHIQSGNEPVPTQPPRPERVLKEHLST